VVEAEQNRVGRRRTPHREAGKRGGGNVDDVVFLAPCIDVGGEPREAERIAGSVPGAVHEREATLGDRGESLGKSVVGQKRDRVPDLGAGRRPVRVNSEGAEDELHVCRYERVAEEILGHDEPVEASSALCRLVGETRCIVTMRRPADEAS
jgi:hypothetical protein